MFSKKIIFKISVVCTMFMLFSGYSQSKTVNLTAASTIPQATYFDLYKSPTCGCCTKWLDHMNENGFQSKIHHLRDVSIIKREKNIAPRYRSCHTAISKDGYVFEGHVPAKFVKRFLNENHPDEVLGLSVPAMPVGSPGMEVGDKFRPYQVLLLKADGSYDVYESVKSYKEQF